MLQALLYNGIVGCQVSLAGLLGQAVLEAIFNNMWGFKFASLPKWDYGTVSMTSITLLAGDLPTELLGQTGPPLSLRRWTEEVVAVISPREQL